MAVKKPAPAVQNKADEAKPETQEDTTPVPVSLDFAAMTVTEVADVEELKSERGSKYDNSPVKGWLQESYETKKGKQVQVPTKAHADLLAVALRSVAPRLKVGVKIVIKPVDAAEPDGAQIVRFLGKEKRNYKPTAPTTEAVETAVEAEAAAQN